MIPATYTYIGVGLMYIGPWAINKVLTDACFLKIGKTVFIGETKCLLR